MLLHPWIRILNQPTTYKFLYNDCLECKPTAQKDIGVDCQKQTQNDVFWHLRQILVNYLHNSLPLKIEDWKQEDCHHCKRYPLVVPKLFDNEIMHTVKQYCHWEEQDEAVVVFSTKNERVDGVCHMDKGIQRDKSDKAPSVETHIVGDPFKNAE